MVRRRQRERSLFEVLLPDGHKLWPDWLRRIDTLLEDEAVIEVVAQALEARWPQSRRRGRPGTPAEIVIRMLILKHLFDWSYDDLEQEVRANLVYRAFTRIDAGEVPDAKTILKIAGAGAERHRTVVPAGTVAARRRERQAAARAEHQRGRRHLRSSRPFCSGVPVSDQGQLVAGRPGGDGARLQERRSRDRKGARSGDPQLRGERHSDCDRVYHAWVAESAHGGSRSVFHVSSTGVV
jgi:hypothetical protein